MEESELVERRSVSCPCCGKALEVLVEADLVEADLVGELVVDREVCCRPWRVRIVRTGGRAEIEIGKSDE